MQIASPRLRMDSPGRHGTHRLHAGRPYALAWAIEVCAHDDEVVVIDPLSLIKDVLGGRES